MANRLHRFGLCRWLLAGLAAFQLALAAVAPVVDGRLHARTDQAWAGVLDAGEGSAVGECPYCVVARGPRLVPRAGASIALGVPRRFAVRPAAPEHRAFVEFRTSVSPRAPPAALA